MSNLYRMLFKVLFEDQKSIEALPILTNQEYVAIHFSNVNDHSTITDMCVDADTKDQALKIAQKVYDANFQIKNLL